MSILDEFPFPFHKPAGHELWRTLASLVPAPPHATALDQTFHVVQLGSATGLTPRHPWHMILELTAAKGTTRDLTADVLAQNPRSPKAPFLKKLIDDQPVVVSPEPVDD